MVLCTFGNHSKHFSENIIEISNIGLIVRYLSAIIQMLRTFNVLYKAAKPRNIAAELQYFCGNVSEI
jgi:hypothetical protein